MKKLILTLFVILAVFVAKAQIVNVCGNDTIMLTVDNYVNGTIEWQESIDTINWATVPEVSGLTYTFFPTQTKYYRAIVKTTDCGPLYSAISLVQLSPVANAGIDRTIGNTTMTLLGNSIHGSTGEWTILSGTGGLFDNQFNPKALFKGINKEVYSLKWTLTNACGQSSDTVVVTFDEIISRNNYIVFDNTDSLFSESTEIANGIYRIKFSDPTIAPFDSVMLIAMREDISCLRRVNTFTLEDSIYTFITEQGLFEDLFTSGTLNMGDVINQSFLEGSTLRSANSFPTRQTLKENAKRKDIVVLYSNVNSGNTQLRSVDTDGTDNKEIILAPPSKEIFEFADGAFKLTLEDFVIGLTPNFVSDLKIFPPQIKFGLNNAIFRCDYTIKYEATAGESDLLDSEKELLNIPPMRWWIFPPSCPPIELSLHMGIKAKSEIGIVLGASVVHKGHYTNNFTAIMTFDLLNPYFPHIEKLSSDKFTSSIEKSYTNTTSFGINGEFEIGPEISFRLYEVFGPYVRTPLKIDLDLRSNTDLNWSGKASLGFNASVGVKTFFKESMLFNRIPDFDYHLDFGGDEVGKLIYSWPNEIELLNGNFQKGKEGEALLKPINFEVLSSFGIGVPFVPVRFELEDGNGHAQDFDDTKLTDLNGRVSYNWVLGTNPVNKLKAYVLDYQHLNIENSPIFVTAYNNVESYDCSNSDLYIAIKSGQTYKYPSVSGGAAPYSYSINGIDYNNQVPKFSTYIPGTFTVYVKDKNGCIIVKSFTVNVTDPCDNTDLNLNAMTQANTLQLSGEKGTPPYQFSIDNQDHFSKTTLYSKLSVGDHIIFVKDANGCIVSSSVKIEDQTTPAIRSSYPVQGATSIPVSGFTFNWQVGNYATNQKYDIYLKKTSEAYNLIASNLTTSSYTYTTTLSNNTIYTWKLAVKGSDGVVIDNNEFTFTTASGIATTPTVPVLKLPANGATSQSFPLSLSWEKQTGDFKYDLYLDTKDATTLVAMNFPNDLFTFAKLESERTYYWKVKVKSTITGATAVSEVRSFTTLQGAGETVTDIDGNVYHTVKVGSQTWMVENLNTTRYRNGESIGTTTSANKDISGESAPKYQWTYNGDENNASKYGRLYTWYAVNDSRNLAPTGWHVASDAEWTTLENYLIANGYNYDGTTTGNKIAKSLAATTDWNSYTGIGTIGNDLTKNNSSGFAALPGGRYYSGTFYGIGDYGSWWSSTEGSTTSAWFRNLYYDHINLSRLNLSKSYGFSVRCVSDDNTPVLLLPILSTTAANNIKTTSATSGGIITNDGGSAITASGVCWNTSPNPTTANSKTTDGTGLGSFTSSITDLTANTQYYVRAYATNSVGTSYGNAVLFTTLSEETMTDIDGNVYHTVKIGSQTWMVENLKTTRYRNGESIGTTTPATKDIRGESTPKYQWAYNGDESNSLKYGRYYTWYAVNDSRNLAPIGWHVASAAEWTTMEDYLRANGYSYEGINMSYKIAKSLAASTVWKSDSGSGVIGNDLTKNNTSGFSALPGSYRFIDGSFDPIGFTGFWWFTNESSSTLALSGLLGFNYSFLERRDCTKSYGFSVRCVKE